MARFIKAINYSNVGSLDTFLFLASAYLVICCIERWEGNGNTSASWQFITLSTFRPLYRMLSITGRWRIDTNWLLSDLTNRYRPLKLPTIYLKGTTEINFLPNYIICPLTRISRRRRCESRVIVCSKRTPNGWKTDRNKSSLSQYIATRQQSKVWHPPIYTTDKLYSFRSPYFARWHFNRSCKRRGGRSRRRIEVEGHPRQVRGFPHSQLAELRIFVWGGSCPEHTFLLLNVHMGTTDSTTGDTPLGCGWPTSHIALKSNNKLARYAFARWMAIIIIIILVIITVVVGIEKGMLCRGRHRLWEWVDLPKRFHMSLFYIGAYGGFNSMPCEWASTVHVPRWLGGQ